MSARELSDCLKNIYTEMSARHEAALASYLFAALYSEELKDFKNKDRLALVRRANLPDSYAREIYKGLKLAPYIELTPYRRNLLLRGGAAAENSASVPPYIYGI